VFARHDDATIGKFIATFEALHPRQEGSLVHMYGQLNIHGRLSVPTLALFGFEKTGVDEGAGFDTLLTNGRVTPCGERPGSP